MSNSVISPLDDYPIHQIPQPVRFVETSDRNFYDRYYFNVHDGSGDLFLICGLGVYPNLGVMDAFAAIRRGDDYQVVRASKALGSARDDMTVGPFTLSIIEPLKRLRLTLDETEWPLRFDLEWSGLIEPHFEPSRFRRDRNGRITHDHCRFGQTGRWSGWLEFDGVRQEVTSERWMGFRDRSWGIRPVGEAEPERAADRDPGGVPSASHFWNYAPMIFRDFTLMYIAEEDGNGRRSMEEAIRYPHDGGPPVKLGKPQHDLRFVAGSRLVSGGTITMQEPDGEPVVVEIIPRLPVWIFVGTGYRQVDHWRHGKYQGELAVEGVRYSFRDGDDLKLMRGTVDIASQFSLNGEVGVGMFECSLAGAIDRYGFEAGGDIVA